MDLLFKRSQEKRSGKRAQFKLWAKCELNAEEQSLYDRYGFNDTTLIEVLEPEVARKALTSGIFLAVVSAPITLIVVGRLMGLGPFAALAASVLIGIAYARYRFDQKRETIYVKDIVHGRNFDCSSVVELARKEARLQTTIAFFRQVMESAKHWDGVVKAEIPALNVEEARRVIIRGF